MAKSYEGFLICCDCDGTLLNDEGKVSKQNADAITRFQRGGGIFTVATGRLPEFVLGFQSQFMPNAPVISINGTMIYDLKKKEVLYSKPMSENPLGVVMAAVALCQNLMEVRFVCSAGPPAVFRPGEGVSPEQMCDNLPSRCYKLVFTAPPDDCIALKTSLVEQFGERYSFMRSWPEALEVQSPGTGKGECLPRLKKLIVKDIHTTIGIGDYENDLTLFHGADIGYAVDNAMEEVKRAADRVTVSNNDHAVAKVIGEI